MFDHAIIDHIEAMGNIQPYRSTPPNLTPQTIIPIWDPKFKKTKTKSIAKKKSTSKKIVKKGTKAQKNTKKDTANHIGTEDPRPTR